MSGGGPPRNRLGGGGEGRMRIRAFPIAPDEPYISGLWDKLSSAIKEIQGKNNSGLSFEELYRNAYTMVLHKKGEQLYSGTKEVIQEHLNTSVKQGVVGSLGNNFLATLIAAWTDHFVAMVMVRDILMYMDRVYVTSNHLTSVYNMGLDLFRDQVLMTNEVRTHLETTLLEMVAKERGGDIVDRQALKSACTMLINLSTQQHRETYTALFEDKFLTQSTTFYRSEAEVMLSTCSASVYINKVKERMSEESERARNYLDKDTDAKILNVLRNELLKRHMRTIVEMENSGVVQMLKHGEVTNLRCMYELFEQVEGGLTCIRDTVSGYLLAQGRLLVDEGIQSKNPITFIQNLLELKVKFDLFLADSFANNRLFKQRISTDFEQFINQNDKSAEYLSLYVDDKLKKGSRGGSMENEAERSLDDALTLFRYLWEKDVFERYYKQHLAKRLLLNKNSSEELEKLMISKLKIECGCHFTSKLEGMFKDMEVSTTLNDEFKRVVTRQASDSHGVDINVRVLTTGFWPGQNQSALCVLPPTADAAFEKFRVFYLEQHSGRKLSLQAHLGSAELTAHFYPGQATAGASADGVSSSTDVAVAAPSTSATTKTHILVVPSHHMVLLMLFNSQPSWSFEELKARTHIPEKDLLRVLISLSKPGQRGVMRVLIKTPVGRDIEDGHTFTVNDAFTSKLFKVKITTVSAKGEADPDRAETRQKVEEDRNFEVDAAIVRVMKARRAIAHNQLIEEVTEQLRSRFLPSPALIKRRIENLIEREYVERSVKNKSSYNYVA